MPAATTEDFYIIKDMPFLLGDTMSEESQIETMIDQSRWSAKRVVLFYWLALFFVGAGVTVGLGFQLTHPHFTAPNNPHETFSEPWHPENCTCHVTNRNQWSHTGHATGVVQYNSSHILIGGTVYVTNEEFAANCSHCMATRAETVGGVVVWWDLGVTCAACHDPGVINHTASVCGQCHTGGADFPRQLGDYLNSAHYDSLNDLLASDDKADWCLHCMAGQGLYAEDVLFNLTLSNPELATISCQTCHDPHSALNAVQLRYTNSTELCGQCHQEAKALFTGAEDDSPSKHYSLGLNCADCHGYQLGRDEVNHTWLPDLPHTCSQTGCHTTNTAVRIAEMEEFQANITALLAEFDTLLADVTAKAKEANNTEDIDETAVESAFALIADAEALADLVSYDPHTGFQNPALARSKMLTAIEKLNQAYDIADEAIKDTKSEEEDDGVPGFLFIDILILVSLVSAITLAVRKRNS
ncbi:MAG: cytochrome c3 family protein [Candidatus Thorarchaeota archaeon]